MQILADWFINMSLKLSKHFEIAELLITSHTEYTKEQADTCDLVKLTKICTQLLEPVRAYYNKPITVTSGYRCPGLNTKIKGSKTSQHCLCEAVDFIIDGIDVQTIFNDIRTKKIDIKYGQLILEMVAGKFWIHLSLGVPYRAANKCMQNLKTTDGKTYITI